MAESFASMIAVILSIWALSSCGDDMTSEQTRFDSLRLWYYVAVLGLSWTDGPRRFAIIRFYAPTFECAKMMVAHNVPPSEWCLDNLILHKGFIVGYLFAPMVAHLILQCIM